MNPSDPSPDIDIDHEVSQLIFLHGQSQRATFEMNRGQVRRRVRQIDLDAHVGAQIDQILTEAMESVDISKDTRLFDVLGFIQGWSFVLALVSLVVFTLLNMPF